MTWWSSQQSIVCCARVPLHLFLPAQPDAAHAACEAVGLGDTAGKLRGLDPAVRAWWRHHRDWLLPAPWPLHIAVGVQ